MKCIEIIKETNKRCTTQASYNYHTEKKPKYCKAHMPDATMICVKGQNLCIKCQQKNAEFGKKGGQRLHCKGCKEEGDLNLRCRYCQDKDCQKRASYAKLNERPEFCFTHKKPGMINVDHALCQKEGCNAIALYNFEGQKGQKYCGKHKDPKMTMVYKKQKCIVCKKTEASYNFKDEKKALYCDNDKKDGMINILRKECHVTGCRTVPSYNYKGNTKPVSCKKHIKPGMVDVVTIPCLEVGCKTQPNFNYDGEKKGVYCGKHKKTDMINVKTKKCFCGATSPHYNLPGLKTRKYCVKCKKDGMIDVSGKFCQHSGCPAKALFNFPGQEVKFCFRHTDKGMINLRSRKCLDPKCSENKTPTTASYGFPGNTPERCSVHKDDGMVYSPKQKCIHQECKNKEFAIYGKDSMNPKYCETHAPEGYISVINHPCKGCNMLDILDKEGYCVTCNPESFATRRLAKQRDVIAWLNVNGHGDYRSIDECTSELLECKENKNYGYRPDILYDMGSYFIIVEIDETQHSSEQYRLCETPRMVNIQQALALPTIFIRYNPDNYKINGVSIETNKTTRLATLANWIKHAKENVPKEALQVAYLFYDEYNNLNNEYQVIDILSVAKLLASSAPQPIIKRPAPSLRKISTQPTIEKVDDQTVLVPPKIVFKWKQLKKIDSQEFIHPT